MLVRLAVLLVYLLVAVPGWLIVLMVTLASLRPAARPRVREWLLLGVPSGVLLATSVAGGWVLLTGPTTLDLTLLAIALGAAPIVTIFALLKLKRLIETLHKTETNHGRP